MVTTRAYQEAEVEAGDDGGGDGEGGELEVAEVADEGLRDDVHPVERDPLEDGRADDVPELLRLHPPLHRRPPRRLGGGRAAAHFVVDEIAERERLLQQRRRPRLVLLLHRRDGTATHTRASYLKLASFFLSTS